MLPPADAFVVVWAFCAAGVTFHFSKHLPVLGYGVRALQNIYLPPENDRGKQQSSMVQRIKDRCAAGVRGWAERSSSSAAAALAGVQPQVPPPPTHTHTHTEHMCPHTLQRTQGQPPRHADAVCGA
jgi:hypothetical protein